MTSLNNLAILLATLLLCNTLVLATKKHHYQNYTYYSPHHHKHNHYHSGYENETEEKEPEPEPEEVEPETETCQQDNGEAAGLVKEAVLSANFTRISEIFQIYCDAEASLARGFDFESDEELLRPTSDRLNDPDIVSFKGLAYHSVQTKEYERLANIFLYSLYGDGIKYLV